MNPLAVFVYNRPEHTNLMFESLSDCSDLDRCSVYIYCDGPKGENDKDNVNAARKVAKYWANKLGATLTLRETNYGLSKSIIIGVTELCEKFGRTIVVEDDLIVSPDFISYMLQALDRYENDTNIYQVTGFMFPIDISEGNDAVILPFTGTWGWATWQRAWKALCLDTEKALIELQNEKIRELFDLGGNYPYFAILKARAEGRNDSWGILWWWSVFKENGLVIHPRESLVWVGGWDGTGTHCSDVQNIGNTPPDNFNYPKLSDPISFPDDNIVNEEVFKNVKRFLSSQKKTSGAGLFSRVYRKCRNFLEK